MISLAQTFGCAGFFNGPAVFEAPVDCTIADTKALLPLGDCESFTIVRNVVINASVIALLLLGFPLAILFAIMAIVIGTIQGFIWRTFTHVCKEICKDMPSFADSDAASTVVAITSALRIVAALEHSGPYPIDARINQPMLESSPVSSHASAGSCVTTTKAAGNHFDRFPAGAFTKPSGGMLSILWNTLNCRQLGKFLSRNNLFGHRVQL